MRNNSSTQKQINNIEPTTLLQFKATSSLNKELSKEYKRKDQSSISRPTLFQNTGKELIKQGQLEKLMSIQKTNIDLESEVKALSYYQIAQTRDQTKEMIDKQIDSRRTRHIKLITEFDNWKERMYTTIAKNYQDIKIEGEDYLQKKEREIKNYWNNIKDSTLLEREKDIIDEIKTYVENCKNDISQRVSELDVRLQSMEEERERIFHLYLDRLEANINDVAFQLIPQNKEIIVNYKDTFQSEILELKIENDNYMDSINEKVNKTYQALQETSQQKIDLWRQLKHDQALQQFLARIKQREIVHPGKRVELYQSLNKLTNNIFNHRIQQLQSLTSLSPISIVPNNIKKISDQLKNDNDNNSQLIDKCIENLVNEQKESAAFINNIYDTLKARLHYIEAKSFDDLDNLLSTEYLPLVDKLNESSMNLLKSGISFTEDADLQQQEILSNFTKFYTKIADLNDSQTKQIINHKRQYEIQKAKIADQNDENIDNLNKQFEALKVELQTSLHHPKLDETLQKAFLCLDQIEQEYREFHEKNIEVSKVHPQQIKDLFVQFDNQLAALFDLVQLSAKDKLVEAERQKAEEWAKKRIAKEEKLKQLEEQRLIEEAKNKKGAKVPTSKPKDPKKAAQEYEERIKELIKQRMEQMQIASFQSQLQNNYLESVPIQQQAKNMYKICLDESNQNQPQEQKQEEEEDEDNPPPPVDFIKPSPIDPLGNSILNANNVVKLDFVLEILKNARNSLFDYISKRLNENIEDAKGQDKDFVEQSIFDLDERLKKHYPLKGKTEVNIYQVRAAQITIHKKRYERHAKSIMDQICNQQTQFNILIEDSLNKMKEFDAFEKDLIDQLSTAQSLAKFQGLQNSSREHNIKYNETISTIVEQLTQLATKDLISLLNKNSTFIKESKLFDNGGDYSETEIEWYKQMILEFDQQIQKQQSARPEKINELSNLLKSKISKFMETFEQKYNIAIDELAAREGTGKKYGRPKRLAQERLRSEMTKCEKAQIAINSKLEEIQKIYELFKNKQDANDNQFFDEINPSLTLKTRTILQEVLLMIKRYSSHIDALKVDNKVQDLPRITRNEEKYDTVQDGNEEDEYKKFIEQTLEQIGPLQYQKENKKLMEWVTDIEKTIVLESQKIYSGAYAKYLTGNDKIPDWMRLYIEQMKKNIQEFNIQCIRDLRNSCDQLSNLAKQISEIIFKSISSKFSSKYYSNKQTLKLNLKQTQ